MPNLDVTRKLATELARVGGTDEESEMSFLIDCNIIEGYYSENVAPGFNGDVYLVISPSCINDYILMGIDKVTKRAGIFTTNWQDMSGMGNSFLRY